MKRNFLFVLTVLALSFAFIACDKDNGEKDDSEKVTLTFSSNDIVLDLGSSNADLLQYVSASDGSSVSVSGVNFNLVGEQTATFTAGTKTETKKVKIKADKIAGRYSIAIYDNEGNLSTQGDGWIAKFTTGNDYNQILIPSTIGEHKIFTDLNELVVTFDKEKASIAEYEGGFLFLTTPPTATFAFKDIKYGKDESDRYAILSMTLDCYAQGYQPFMYTVSFTKIAD